MISCSKALKNLYPGLSPALIQRITDSSHGDLRQCCLKCWIYGKEITNPQKTSSLLKQSEEDSFWGVFHMIKKLLLAKRTLEGDLENDFDAMFLDNAISLQEATSYLYANVPEYTSDIEDLAGIYDVLCMNEYLGTKSTRRSHSYDEKGNESFSSIADRLRFYYIALAVPVYNHHPTSRARSFAEIKASSYSGVLAHIQTHQSILRTLYDRYVSICSSSIGLKQFVLDVASILTNVHADLANLGEHANHANHSNSFHKLIDIPSFVNLASLVFDMDDVIIEFYFK